MSICYIEYQASALEGCGMGHKTSSFEVTPVTDCYDPIRVF